MAHDPNFPANDSFLADFPPQLRAEILSLINDTIVNAGLLNGLKSGNGQGNIPVSNGVENKGLNAEKVGGSLPSAFAPAAHGHTVATGSSSGFMANTDKAKIDTIATSAEVNQMAFSNVLIKGVTIQADSKTDTLEIVEGANITLTPDAVNDRMTIAVSGKVVSAGTADTAGACTGNSVTSTSTPLLSALGNYVWTGTTPATSYPQGVQASFVQADSVFPSYGSVLNVNTYGGCSGALQLYVPYGSAYGGTHLKARMSDLSASGTWTALKDIAWTSDIPTVFPATGGTAQNSNQLTVGGSATTFNWSGQDGQPSWLWGGNAPGNMYVYNPANFNVNYAKSAGSVPWSGVTGAPAPVSSLVTDFIVQANTTEITISGLNLDPKCVYALRFVLNPNAQDSWIRMFANGDKVDAHYYHESNNWRAGLAAVFSMASHQGSTYKGDLLTNNKGWTTEGVNVQGRASQNPFFWDTNGYLINTPITSLTFVTEVANCITAGSRFRIYKL